MRNPIGVFDSGVGGLTVVREILARLPDEEIVYFGDTARVPYGSKSEGTITKFGLQAASFLISKGVKLIVVACNTVSSNSLETLEQSLEIPIIGVIRPGAEAACAATKTGRVGVIGTVATVESRAYEEAIRSISPEVDVLSRSCPLFVPLVEEGWIDHEATYLVAREYLAPFKEKGIDTLVLGCTHYPLLKGPISRVMGEGVALIDSAEETASEVEEVLSERGILTRGDSPAEHSFFLSDIPRKFSEIARFLGQPIPSVTRVDLETDV